MSVRYFGIFLAYGPTVDLQKEGLGRLLSAFLKAAASLEDVRFVIACPQWSKKSLLAFCEDQNIPTGAFDIVSTDGVPFLLKVYLAIESRKAKERKKARFAMFLERLKIWTRDRLLDLARGLVPVRSFVPWLIVALLAAIVAVAVAPVLAVIWLARNIGAGFGEAERRLRGISSEPPEEEPAALPIPPPPTDHRESLSVRLYRLMEEAENERMLKKINALQHVKAWYSPTAFWPAFNRISAPRLLCVPDVLPAEFPVSFSLLAPELLENFRIVERSIRGAAHFVTYSSRVKWSALVDRYFVDPDAVSVIPHASWDLSPWIKVRGFADSEQATTQNCHALLQQALTRVTLSPHMHGLVGGSPRFLFYASQFRPNKNMLTLLRAYDYLLREGLIQHKLILTGDPKRFSPVEEFIEERQLGRDVLCLHALTTAELAACYHLADLVVNPSLSEGGLPFTLTEAVSVDTPVVMARIPVTEEAVTDPSLQDIMLFDPYDWRDAARRIEWALGHRETLLEAQRQFCIRLGERTWLDVVRDHVAVLDRLASTPVPVEAGLK